jgi:hypothetical protein
MTTTLATIAERRSYGSATDFMNSLADQLARRGGLSERQVAAAERIIARNREDVAQPEPVGPGVYETPDGNVYVVKQTQDKQRVYAKRMIEIGGERLTEADTIVKIDFEYAPGAIRDIRSEHRMSLTRAEELQLMIRYGRCICCGRNLKAADSVARGIGPVCRGYFSTETFVAA